MALVKKFLGKTDIGRKRPINEDAFFCSEEESICIVADGMGGHSFGEIASKLAVAEVRAYFQKHIYPYRQYWENHLTEAFQRITQELQQAIGHANSSIHGYMKRERQGKPMGTTIVVVYFLANFAFLAHVGDSRAYVFRRGRLLQLTEDHTVINRWLKIGQITKEQAIQYRNSPSSRFVTRSLGLKAEVRADTSVHPVQSGDLFLLCTDGLIDLVTDEEIARKIRECNGDLEKLSKSLISIANGRGGKDNITVVLAHFFDDQAKEEDGEQTEVFYRTSSIDGDTEIFVRDEQGKIASKRRRK